MCGRLRMGRKLAKSSKRLRSSTLMLEKPPPIGVVTGPFNPTRVRSMDSLSSLGMYSWYFSKASAPAAKLSHSNLTPVASRIRTLAFTTSGPMPSPGINVTLYDIVVPSNWPESVSGLGFGRRVVLGVEQFLQLSHELAHVFEIQINRGEAYIGDFIDALQAIHDQFADFAGFALTIGRVHHEALGIIDDLLQSAHGDRPLLARPQQPIQHFLTLELFAPPVFLDHHVGDLVDPLIGREVPLALQALAAEVNGIEIRG